MPPKPYEYYSSHWTSWGDFLGSDYIAGRNRKYINFNKAKEKIKKHNFSSREKYHSWLRASKIQDLPFNPEKHYSQNWNGWSDFLGKV